MPPVLGFPMGCVTNFPAQNIDTSRFAKNIVAIGPRDCSNVDFSTPSPFIPETLEVFLDGRRLMHGVDFNVGIDSQSFSLSIQPGEKNRLNMPPKSSEEITVNYITPFGVGVCVINLP